ncbi:MAG: FmdB family transcriptional regulator [Legionellales bacterium]|nr:FmdB family transcriptional regulator [Legionellales bacterium]
MPIYEYRCDQCGHQFEVLQKISDAPVKNCPKCNSNNPRRLVSAAAFKLKGTGWYETDFKTKKPKKGDEINKANQDKKDINKKTADPKKNSKNTTNGNKKNKIPQ